MTEESTTRREVVERKVGKREHKLEVEVEGERECIWRI